VGDLWASAAPEWIRVIEQRYDFATAELRTVWTFTVNGATATIETIAFCSRTVPALAACDVQVKASRRSWGRHAWRSTGLSRST
jgi:hypothetical protein